MEHKYKVKINWSEADQAYIAQVPELDGVVTHGESIVEAALYAEEAIALHLESLEAHDQDIPEPVAIKNLSGQMALRMGKGRHEVAYIKACRLGLSLNEYVSQLIDLDEDETLTKKRKTR